MRQIKILWAEDDTTTFRIYSDMLKTFLAGKDLEAEITWAEDGNAVFRHLSYDEDKGFDVLITDIVMPHFNGLDTVAALKKRHPGLPMLVISLHTESEEFGARLSELVTEDVIDGFFSLGSTEAWFDATWRLLTLAPTILHLSDIHFGSDHAFKGNLRISDFIKKLLKSRTAKQTVDIVVVSGDLTSCGTEKEFQRAEEFLLTVADTCGLGLNRFVIVPGNHDIYRKEEEGRRFIKFVEFLDRFYGRLPDPVGSYASYPELYDAKRNRLYWDAGRHSEDSLYNISIFDQLQTIVIGLNSVIGTGDERFDLSKIEPMQLIKVSERLDALTYPQVNHFRIAVFHHSPFVVPSFSSEGDPERVVRNPTLVLNELIRNRISLLLHGHTHYSIGVEYRPIFLDGNRANSKPLYVFGAGTLSGNDLTISQSYYYLSAIRFGLNDSGILSSAVVNPYRLRDDGLDWESVAPVQIDFV